jgi:UDP-N-acetylmuramyl pentapeptide synthase
MGDMLELGQYSEAEHAKILQQALSLANLKAIFVKGEKFQNLISTAKQKDKRSQFGKVHVLHKTEDFPVALLSDLLDQESVILIKGSRMMNMEEYVDLLRNNLL